MRNRTWSVGSLPDGVERSRQCAVMKFLALRMADSASPFGGVQPFWLSEHYT
jgi:hypothetical protein